MDRVYVNPDHCIGCHHCEFACAVEHSSGRNVLSAVFEQPRPRPRVHVEAGPWLNTSFPNLCRHCDPAPCERVCPTAAMHRDPELGLMLVDGQKCIACAMCAMVCPFDVVTFHAAKTGGTTRVVATKCDGCVDRRRAGEEPACVEACKTDALLFGDLNTLVAANRERASAELLRTANADASRAKSGPRAVAGWRAWGEAATSVAKGADHGQASSR
jgi:carbon-monoxide dehydrogenase iron sulfur subunit